MRGFTSQVLEKKDVIRVKAKIYDNNSTSAGGSETKTFSVDPELTTFPTLREILIKAFNLKEDFLISYLVSSGCDDRYLPMLSEWDLNTAIYVASDPYLQLKIDPKLPEMSTDFEEWNIIDDTHVPSGIVKSNSIGSHSSKSTDSGISKSTKRRSWFFNDDHSSTVDNSKLKTHPMTEAEFKSYLDAEGRLLQSNSFREAVYLRGLKPNIRQSVWPHLLDVYPQGLTFDERTVYAKRLGEKYECLKESWQRQLRRGYIDEELRLVANSVRKDVIRTDRLHPFYAGDENRNASLMALFNILTTYALAHPEVSYCQGMSDLVSPLLVVMKDESMAYLCFCALMRRMRDSFSCDGWTMTRKFHHLSELVQYYDPIFYEYLREMHSEDLLFAYRWLLLELKREFAFDDALILMEITWASLPARPPESGCDLDLYDVDLTAVCRQDDDTTTTGDDWRLEKNEKNGERIRDANSSSRTPHIPIPTAASVAHSCPGIFACSNGVCPALVVRSLMLNHKENKRLHAIRHASYPPKSTVDDVSTGAGQRRARHGRFTIGYWTEDMNVDMPNENPKNLLDSIFDHPSDSDLEEEDIGINTDATPSNTVRPQPATRTYNLRPSPELKVCDITDSFDDHQPIPMATEAYSDYSSSDDGPYELTLSRIHEICMSNVPTDGSTTNSGVQSSKASSSCISRRSREPSGNAGSKIGTTSAFTASDVHYSTRASTNLDSGVFENASSVELASRASVAGSLEPPLLLDMSEFVNVDRDPTVALPPPHELGDGNPFMLFVCLTLILQNRDHMMKNRLDFNEIAVYFDKLMRKHDVRKVLKRARVLYADYLRLNVRHKTVDTNLGISKAVAMTGIRYFER